MPDFLDAYRRLSRLPFGRALFSRAVGFVAPYFSTIGPEVVDYGPGYAEIAMRDRRRVHNHIGTIHAIAMCNLAELCGGIAIDSALPKSLRWIPQGMTVKYVKKAKGRIVGRCRIPPEAVREGSVIARVDVVDGAGDIVFYADIDFHVSQNKRAGAA